MEKLNKDVLFYLACKMDITTFVKISKVSKVFYDKIYKEKYIWLYKIEKEFPNSQEYISNYIKPREFKSTKEQYIAVYSSLQEELHILEYYKNVNIIDIYSLYYILNPIQTSKKDFFRVILTIIKISEKYVKYIYILYSWISKNLDYVDPSFRKVVNSKLLELGNIEKGLLKKFGFLLDAS